MQNLQSMKPTLLDPNIQSPESLHRFTERLSSGLPGLQGNTLLLLKIGVPTPSAGVVLPGALREQMRIQFYLDVAPDKKFIRHVRPHAGAEETAGSPHSDAGGPVYRMWVSRLPIPCKHAAISRLNF
jgi:hypothetical protein